MTATRDQILSTLRERILAYAASRIGRDLAEDLTQEALLLIEQKYGHVERMEELVPLSFQILRFKMNDFRRKAVRRGEFTSEDVHQMPLADGSASVQEELERKEREQRLAAALSRMDGRCREIFRMKLEGKGFGEIRAALQVASVNTVYTWDFRCRKQLLERMGGQWQ